MQLPAAINFAHYTNGTGQVRSNTFVDRPWQLREFKTNINTKGEAVFVADSVATTHCLSTIHDHLCIVT
jgi:hypothetical protein